MASDLILVLGSEHRRLLQVLDRSSRAGRGLSDPVHELRREVAAHVAAAGREVVPLLGRCEQQGPLAWAGGLDAAADVAAEGDVGTVQRLTADLVRVEQTVLVPWLEQALTVEERRRAGKLYRVRREAHARTPLARRQRSRTELYELARRAGVENRSRMTQAELQTAVQTWEHGRDRTGVAHRGPTG